jgi:hypothetical protein
VKICYGFAALGEAELMSSVETLTMDSAGEEDRTVAGMDYSHVGTSIGEFHNFDDGHIMV